jgi:hypothetical protein
MDNLMGQLFSEIVIPFVEWSVLALGFLTALSLIWHWRQRRSDIMRETYEVFYPSTAHDGKDFLRSLSGLPKPVMLEPAQTTTFDRVADNTGEHSYATTSGRTSARFDELFYQQLDVTLEPVEREDDPYVRRSGIKP